MSKKGCKLTKEHIRNISLSHIGLKQSEETKAKKNKSIRFQYQINPNMGMRGKKAWNKGLTKETDENVMKYSQNLMGHKFSDITRAKMSKSTKGKHNSPKTEFTKENRSRLILPKKDTSIEVKLQNYLKQLNIEFFTHQYMHIEHGYQCDILIPKQDGIDRTTVIECFGDYWHKIPYGNPLDSLRCHELREKGYRVLVFWEREIKVMELNDFKNLFGG